MVLPLLAARLFASAGTQVIASGGKPNIKLTAKWSLGGAGIRRRLTKGMRNVDRAALRATNRAGRWGRTRVRRELSDLLNVTQKNIRDHEFRAASLKKPTYRYTIYRREYPIRDLKGVRFRPFKGQGRGVEAVGKLRVKRYGKPQVFDRVLRKQGKYGVTYTLLPRTKGQRPSRVRGTWVKEGYRGPAKIKKQLPKVFRKEFRRHLRHLNRRR